MEILHGLRFPDCKNGRIEVGFLIYWAGCVVTGRKWDGDYLDMLIDRVFKELRPSFIDEITEERGARSEWRTQNGLGLILNHLVS